MPTFEEIYCQRQRCDKQTFRRDLFWKCLPAYAAPVAWLMGGMSGSFFDADRDLLAGVALAARSEQISEEVRDFFEHPANRRWPRRVLRLRLSTARLRRLARHYLADAPASGADSNPPVPLSHTALARR